MVFGIGKASAANYYVDDTTTCPSGQQTGLDWAHAWGNLSKAILATDLLGYSDPTAAIYVKATGVPYTFNYNDAGNSTYETFATQSDGTGLTWYFDATGVGTVRGSSKSIVSGLITLTRLPWSVYSGNTYSLNISSYPTQSSDTIIDTNMSDMIGLSGVVIVNGVNLIGVSSIANVESTSNSFFFDGTYLYVNANGVNPNNVTVQLRMQSALEVWEAGSYYGGVFRDGLFGQHQSGCTPAIVSNCDFTGNLLDGYYDQSSNGYQDI